jgi:PAS domain S-box-containing protein
MTTKLSGLAIGVAIMALSIFIGFSQIVQNGDPPVAIKGILDLSHWSFDRDGAVELLGEYEFYWQQHVAPEKFSQLPRPEASGFIQVPATWQGYELNGTKLPGTGYATYRLTVLLKDSLSAKLALKFLNINTAYTVFANGKKILSVGQAGLTPETTVPQYSPQIAGFLVETNRLELIYHVSNFHHARGGARQVIHLGTQEQLEKIREKRLALDLILFGGIFVIGLYHLALMGLGKDDPSAFFFGLFCLLVAIRLLITVEGYLFHILPGISWELFFKAKYLSGYLSVPMFALFLYNVFPQDFHKTIVGGISAVGFLFSIIICLTPARIFTETYLPFQLFATVCVVYALFMLVLCVVRKREDATTLLTGFVFLLTSMVNDLLYANGVIQSGHFVHLGAFIFIFSHAFMLSFRYYKAFNILNLQRVELEKTHSQYEHEVIAHKRADEALRHSEEMYRALFEDNPSMYFTIDAAGTVLSVNHFGAEQLGYTVTELIGQSVLDVFFEPDRPAVQQQLKICLQNPKKLYNWEFRKIRKDGSLLWVKENARATYAPTGEPIVLIVCEDITDGKKTEIALRESEQRFRLLADMAPVMIWMTDLGGAYKYFNKAWLEFTGRASEQEIGASWHKDIHPNDRSNYLETYLTAFESVQEFKAEYRLRRFDGAYRWIFDHGVPRFLADGSFAGYIGSCTDITERKTVEEVLQQARDELEQRVEERTVELTAANKLLKREIAGRRQAEKAREKWRQRNIRAEAIVEAQENERRRFSRELHDGLGQILTGIKFGLEAVKPAMAFANEATAKNFADIQNQLDAAIAEGKRIAQNLMPRVLDELGISLALEHLCQQISQNGIPTTFQPNNLNGSLPPNIEMGLYRIAQEALNNIVKHAEAKTATVQLKQYPASILMLIKDNGKGFSVAATDKKGHAGLVNMYERAAALKGTLAVDSIPGQGTIVMVDLPLPTGGDDYPPEEKP